MSTEGISLFASVSGVDSSVVVVVLVLLSGFVSGSLLGFRSWFGFVSQLVVLSVLLSAFCLSLILALCLGFAQEILDSK